MQVGCYGKILHHIFIPTIYKNFELVFLPIQDKRKFQNYVWLYVLVMSRTRFRVNPHSIVVWMSRNSLLEAGAKFEGEVTAAGLEPRTT